MGMPGIGSRSSYDENCTKPKMGFSRSCFDRSIGSDETVRQPINILPKEQPGNPRADNYTISCARYYGDYLLLEIVYHDCTNYEGKKVLLFKDVTLKDLEEQKLLDPHFSENKKFHSPIARFEPTLRGWEMGVKLMLTLSESE